MDIKVGINPYTAYQEVKDALPEQKELPKNIELLPPHAPGELRTLTWNCHGCRSAKKGNKISLLADVTMNPEVIHLQESWSPPDMSKYQRFSSPADHDGKVWLSSYIVRTLPASLLYAG